ncbi:uncharacterized protein J7T54_005619 [Emericellopsis cladophorae]|uniref:DUF3669 domain-containing protein n=1 Tax=Emericellopsis cladophorae TaxID=2686198 RepID=A0A9Q0BGD4_9HYPO|nr:uncharacterized protein J7T54_005619 [Emericellopsis cladophorae]KAI6783590.1 hypothetical protein J7T54_005619 [Emericellopsis cladophorae]
MQYREIGRGTFGVVFTADEQPDTAVKKSFKGNDTLAVEFEHGLATSFAVTTSVPSLAQELPEPVPRVPWYLSSHGIQKPSAKDPWWIANVKGFPSTNGDGVRNGVFLFERIPPVPRPLQESLIRRFWASPEEQQAALNDPNNRDCMIRPSHQERWSYYQAKGRKRLNNEQKASLRNLQAYVDELQAIGVDCHAVARQIALGLAVGHWEAQHGMTDVEFVIAGRCTPPSTAARSHTLPLNLYDKRDDLGNRTIVPEAPPAVQHGLPARTQRWLVDFDKCNRVRVWDDTLAQDIRMLALGIRANDPYYPNPLPDTQFGWDVFVTFTETYIRAGRHLLQRAFDKVATTDAQLQGVLERPAMMMRESTRIVMNAKRNNEKDVFNVRMRLRKEQGWAKPGWAV